MQRCDQRGQLVFLNVLKLIDEDHQGCFGPFGCHSCRFEESLQVVLEIAVVCQTRLRLQIESHFDVTEFHAKRFGEPGKSAQTTPGQLGRLFNSRKPQQSLPELRSEECGQGTSLRGFDSQRVDSCSFRILTHAIQKHSLSNPSESNHDDALGREAAANALEGNSDRAPQFVSAGEFWRWSARTRSKGVGNWIHRKIIPILWGLSRTDKLTITRSNFSKKALPPPTSP